MLQIIRYFASRFIVKTIWVALLATFGINLLLICLPAKKISDSRISATQKAGAVEKWDTKSYVDWLVKFCKGKPQISDKGTTKWEKKEFWHRASNTLVLCFVAFVISGFLGIFVGTSRAMIDSELVSGPKKPAQSFFTSFGTVALFILSSIPAYITAYFLFLLTSSESNIFLAIIALALGSGLAMDVARLTSNTHSQQLSAKYIENALACGLKTSGVIPIPGYVSWHAFRNSLITILPVTAYRLPLLVSSALLVEIVYDLSGLGESLLTSLVDQDIPKVLTIILISVVFVQVCVFLADVLSYILHPQGGESA